MLEKNTTQVIFLKEYDKQHQRWCCFEIYMTRQRNCIILVTFDIAKTHWKEAVIPHLLILDLKRNLILIFHKHTTKMKFIWSLNFNKTSSNNSNLRLNEHLPIITILLENRHPLILTPFFKKTVKSRLFKQAGIFMCANHTYWRLDKPWLCQL